MARMLESDEAARRLGVKVTTLYAYVSRGLLVSHPSPGEPAQPVRPGRDGAPGPSGRCRSTGGGPDGHGDHPVTQLLADGPLYRGGLATDLAGAASFEEVAEWLWAVPPDDDHDAGPPWTARRPGPDPPALGASDRLRWAVVMAGAHQSLRADLRPETVIRTARSLVATMVEALAPGAGAPCRPPRDHR